MKHVTYDANRGPVRWRRLLLGLAVGGPAALVIVVHVAHMATRWDGTPASSWAASAILVVLLGCFMLLGGLLVVHGVRGTQRLPRVVWSLGLVVLVLSGVCVSALLLGLLAELGVRRATNGRVALAVLALSAVALFLLAVFVWKCAWGDRLSRSWWRVHDLCVLVLPFTLALLFLMVMSLPRLQHSPRPGPPVCVNNARYMAIIFSERSRKRDWPLYGGKNFVLALVAHKLIDIRNPDNLEIFFCPEPGEQRTRPTREAYERVTKETLTRRRFPELTDFAGRRNDEPAYRLRRDEDAAVEPILACVLGDIVVVGFSDGAVRRMDRDDLGLEPDAEIVFGEASASPLLRKLSDL